MADESLRQTPSHETRAMIRHYQESGDKEVLDLLVLEYLPLVKYLAHRFKRDGVAHEDLVQVGSIGLLKALKRYETTGDTKFITYVTPTVIGEIKHYFRDKQWSIQVPRRIKEKGNKIYNTIPELSQKLGRTPSPKDMAHYLQISEEEVLEALEWGQAYKAASLDSVITKDDDSRDITLLSALGKEDIAFRIIEERSELEDILQILEQDEQKLIYLRFERELTQQEIGKIMGMSQMQVSRLLRKTIVKLRKRKEELSI